MIADAGGENRNDFRIGSQSGGEQNYRNEYEQRAEHIDEIRYEVQVVVEDYGIQRGFILHEIVNLLRNVEDDDYADDQNQRHEEGKHEPLEYVPVEFLYH